MTVLVCWRVLSATGAMAEACETAAISPTHTDEPQVFAENRAYADAGRYAEARAMVRWLLARNPENREALIALARLDTWEGCYDRAEPVFRALIDQRPHDVEARVGLIDLLFWSQRFAHARVLIDQGLWLDPQSAELWQRRARYLLWTGDRDRAVDAASHAEMLEPSDADIRRARDPLFLGQVRTALRIDSFPTGYPNIYTADIQALQHFHRFELGAGAQLIDRVGGLETEPIVDGRYNASAQYHGKGGATVGLALGFGLPDNTIPQLEAKAWFSNQLSAQWSAEVSYAYWQYRNDKAAHILAPAIGFAPTDTLAFTARWSISYLTLQEPGNAGVTTGLVHSGSARATWQVLPQLSLGTGYTYGRQLDQIPTRQSFLRLTSHVVGVFADWLVQREWGLQPMIGFESRKTENNVVASVFTAEVAAYLRW